MRTTGVVVAVGLVVAAIAWSRCRDDRSGTPQGGASAPAPAPTRPAAADAAPADPQARGLRAPIAAAHLGGGEVLVAALDVAAKGIKLQRIGARDEIVAERVVLEGVTWSTDADLKVAASPDGGAVTWRGLRDGKLVRQLVLVGPDLKPSGAPIDVAATSCATKEAVYWTDGARVTGRPWKGGPLQIELPKEKDVSLLCGARRAFAVLEEEDRTSLLALGDGGAPISVVRESEFGEDEQRELSEYTVGDDVGVVRLAVSGGLALREIAGGVAGPLRRLRTAIGKDDDVVAVDASPRQVVIVYTQDAPSADAGAGDGEGCTRVAALRVDRQSLEESSLVLSAGRCGHEVGPFFTGALGESVSVAWPERAGGAGKSRAPIVGLAHSVVAPAGSAASARVDQAADALVDAGCDGTTCYAVALTRGDGADVTVPGLAKVLRYR